MMPIISLSGYEDLPTLRLCDKGGSLKREAFACSPYHYRDNI